MARICTAHSVFRASIQECNGDGLRESAHNANEKSIVFQNAEIQSMGGAILNKSADWETQEWIIYW